MMHKKLITAAVLILICMGADARRGNKKPPFELNKHEFSLGIAGHSSHSLFGREFNFMNNYGFGEVSSLTNSYFDGATYSETLTTPFLAVSYLYNFNKHWAIGAYLSHDSATRSFYDRATGQRINKEALHYLSPMFNVRATWLNRPYVRMYTTWGLGVTVIPKTKEAPGTGVLPAAQFNPIGISAGKKLFGFAEMGVGTCYFGGTVGIGYRF